MKNKTNFYWENKKKNAVNLYVKFMQIWYIDFWKINKHGLNVDSIYEKFKWDISHGMNFDIYEEIIKNCYWTEYITWEKEIKDEFVKRWEELRNEKEAKN